MIVGSLKSLSLIMSTLEKDAIQPLLKSFRFENSIICQLLFMFFLIFFLFISSMITDDVKVLETLIGELVPLAISCAGADTKRYFKIQQRFNSFCACCLQFGDMLFYGAMVILLHLLSRLHYGDDFTSAIHKSCKLDITPES